MFRLTPCFILFSTLGVQILIVATCLEKLESIKYSSWIHFGFKVSGLPPMKQDPEPSIVQNLWKPNTVKKNCLLYYTLFHLFTYYNIFLCTAWWRRLSWPLDLHYYITSLSLQLSSSNRHPHIHHCTYLVSTPPPLLPPPGTAALSQLHSVCKIIMSLVFFLLAYPSCTATSFSWFSSEA